MEPWHTVRFCHRVELARSSLRSCRAWLDAAKLVDLTDYTTGGKAGTSDRLVFAFLRPDEAASFARQFGGRVASEPWPPKSP